SPLRKINEHLTVCEPLLLPFENRFRLIRWLNHLILYQQLRQVILIRGQIPSVLLTNSPFFSETFTWLPASLRVYDIMDALTRFPWAPDDAEEQERLTLEQADLVTTGTLSLLRAKQREYPHLADRIHYVACGVDVEHFSQTPDLSPQPPTDLASLPRPILGYFGAINERLDTQLLAGLAREMPEASLVLIGPTYGRFPEFLGHPNIHLLGPKPYAELPRYLAAFDCALVPYRLTQGIEFVQPVKVLEYLAGGKPIVSTRIPDVVELYGSLVHLADTPQAFAEAVKRAIREGVPHSGANRSEGLTRRWETMTQEFLDLFTTTENRKQKIPCRIAHLLHGVHLGGAEELVGLICRSLPPDQCQARIVCLALGDRVQERFASYGLSPHIVPMNGKLDFSVLIRLLHYLRRQHIALTHSHTGRTHLLARLLWRLAGIPCVATVHTPVARDLNDPAQTSNRLNAWIDRRTRPWSWKTLCVSKRNYEDILRGKLSPDRILHVPNGIPIPARRVSLNATEKSVLLETLGIQKEPDGIVGMVASLRPRKGPETLLHAMRLVLDRRPNALLLLIGSAEFVQSRDYLAELKKLTQDLCIQNRVRFLGHRNDVATLLPLL
ncbi:MAG TPA: glycosyltransferase, partial [Candidatus Sumerlaeota bacterium]|nr:glycosyltransferase [Candidatus Sumerlaeota bacterium]